MLRVVEMLEGLYNYFKGNTDYVNVPLAIFIAAIDQQGREGDPLVEKYIAFTSESRHRLKVFNRLQRVTLAEKIYNIYCKAYSLKNNFDPELINEVENLLVKKVEYDDSGLIRSFIKWYLSLLDLTYGPPKGQMA